MWWRGGGGVYEKINSEKGRETMCLNKEGGGVYMRKSIVRWNIKCVSRWVLVALSSDIDFTRSEERKRGGGVFYSHNTMGNLHRVVPLTGGKYAYTYIQYKLGYFLLNLT